MNRISTDDIKLNDYAGIVPEQLITEINQLVRSLKGLRVVHVNATFNGGSVNEILKTLTPLMCDAGIDARWYTLTPDESFYCVCKALQRSLQNENSRMSPSDIDLYLANNKKAANTLETMGITADIWLFHDYQVLPMLSYMRPCNGVWVCHDGVTELNVGVRQLLLPHMMNYRVIVSSLPEYSTNNYNPCETVVIPPAIDPLQPEHDAISIHKARDILSGLGIDPARPIICQVSRFDDWSSLRDSIDAYRLAKKKVRGLQLVLVCALTTKDDRDNYGVLPSQQKFIKGDPDVYIYSNPEIIGETEINALQSGADVILQPAGDGFNLRVTEAMWKERPVIGCNCDSIRFQIRDGLTGYVVNDAQTCAKRIINLLKDRSLATMIGSAARESVRKKYLMPRLMRDYLQLFSHLMNRQDKVSASPALPSRV